MSDHAKRELVFLLYMLTLYASGFGTVFTLRDLLQ